MSKIDWKKSPEWANAVIASADGQEFYVSQFGGISARQRVGYSVVDDDASADMIHPHDWMLIETRHPAWSGEGLPPAGTVCELRAHKLTEWSAAKIEFAFRNVIVWDWIGEPSMNGLCTAYAHNVEIRPIRTPEQIAADEREKARDYALNTMTGEGWTEGETEEQWQFRLKIVSEMLDMGYRKQEAK